MLFRKKAVCELPKSYDDIVAEFKNITADLADLAERERANITILEETKKVVESDIGRSTREAKKALITERKFSTLFATDEEIEAEELDAEELPETANINSPIMDTSEEEGL